MTGTIPITRRNVLAALPVAGIVVAQPRCVASDAEAAARPSRAASANPIVCRRTLWIRAPETRSLGCSFCSFSAERRLLTKAGLPYDPPDEGGSLAGTRRRLHEVGRAKLGGRAEPEAARGAPAASAPCGALRADRTRPDSRTDRIAPGLVRPAGLGHCLTDCFGNLIGSVARACSFSSTT